MQAKTYRGAATDLRDRIERILDALEILALELPPTRMMEILEIVEEVRGE